MTYIAAIQRGNRTYYYITKNIRVGLHKWKKIRTYVGCEKPTPAQIKKCVEEIEKKLAQEKSIHQDHAYISNSDAELFEDLKENYALWTKKTPESVRRKIYDDFVIRFTYNTNAIEGNRLTLRQTALILKDKVIPSGIRAADYHEAINGKACMEFLGSYRGGLNTRFLEKINAILTKDTDVVYGGRIRFFDVKIEGSEHVPPSHETVKTHLLNTYKWYSANKNRLHPFEMATLLHAKIAWIHPFEDGNGRTARALMNWMLLKEGYPMFFIPFEKREAYYATLEEADNGKTKAYVANMLRLIIDQIRTYKPSKTD